MYILNEDQLYRLKRTRIAFHYLKEHKSWIEDGLLSIPSVNVQVEDYASFFNRTHFYTIGAFSYSWSAFDERISIGRYCSIAGGVEIMPDSHPTHLFTTSSMIYDTNIAHRRYWYEDNLYEENDGLNPSHSTNDKSIAVGNDVYIGYSAKLRKGITIGDGAIVGAYSLVTKNVPPYAVVVGNPARVVRMRYSDNEIARLLMLQWWNWDFKEIIQSTAPDSIDTFINKLNFLIHERKIKEFKPNKHLLRNIILG
jgi:virginiamycin A acetyltransferase